MVGSGIDDLTLYPRANLRLAQEILGSGGLIISENPVGTKPQTWDFIKRNRLIAAPPEGAELNAAIFGLSIFSVESEGRGARFTMSFPRGSAPA